MKTNGRHKANSEAEELKILQKSAKIGSKKALRASRAMGLSVKVISNNEIIEKFPNGEEKVIRKLNVVPIDGKGLKKGTVLCKK